jgi:O-antigen ligase
MLFCVECSQKCPATKGRFYPNVSDCRSRWAFTSRKRSTMPLMSSLRKGSVAVNGKQSSGHPRVFMKSQDPLPVLRYAYYAFIWSIPFEDVLVEMGIVGEDFSPVKMFVIVFMMIALLQPGLCFRRPPKAFWYFVAYLLVFLFLGILLESEFQRRVIGDFLRYIQLLSLFWICFNLMRHERVVRGTLLTLAISCTALAVLQLLGITSRGEEGRIVAGAGGPGALAGVLSMGLLALMGLAHTWKGMNRKVRWLAWSGFGVLAIAIVSTGARGPLAALTVGFLAFLLQGRSLRSKLKVGLIVLLGIGFLVGVSYQIEMVRARWEKTLVEGKLSQREKIWPAAWQMVQERPLAGWGPISAPYELYERLPGSVTYLFWKSRKVVPHNLVLEILMSTGLLGAVPFFAALWLCWRAAWRAREGIQGVLPMAMLLCLLVSSMNGPMLSRKLFWVVLAYVLASGSFVDLPRLPKLMIRPYRLVRHGSTMHPVSP